MAHLPDLLLDAEDGVGRTLTFLASRREFLAPRQEFLTSRQEFLASRQEFWTPRQEFLASRQEFLASRQEFLASRQEFLASRQEFLGKRPANHRYRERRPGVASGNRGVEGGSPSFRREAADLVGVAGREAFEDVAQVGVEIDLQSGAAGDEAVDDGGT